MPTRGPPATGGDVGAVLHAGEIYAARRVVGGASCFLDARAQADDIEDAAAVRDEPPVVQGRPGVEDERAGRLRVLDSLDRGPGVAARGVVAGGEHDGHGGAVRELRFLREVAGEEREEVALEPREEALGLGIAEAAVELDHAQSVVRPHQARVEEAVERGAAARELAEHRQVHRLEDLRRLVVGDVGQRRERSHAAGVRAGVAVADALVVARGRQGHRRLARGHGEDRELRPFQELLDVERLVERLRDLERRVELGLGGADPDALAGGEPVELDDAGRGRLRQRTGGGHAGGLQHLVRERLRSLDARGRGARAEDGDAVVAEVVGQARDERRLGADDDEVDPELEREGDERGVVVGAHGMAVGERRDPGVARCCVQLVEPVAAGEGPGERMLATPRPDDEHPHRRIV